MDLSWTEEQLGLRDAIVRFAQKELNKDMVARDAEGRFSRELWVKCAEVGLQGMPLPEQYGGQGADPLTTIMALEALGYGCSDNGLIFAINAHMWSAEMPLLRFGTEEQKQRYLPGMCDGTLIGVQGMTEPGSGSDAFGMKTTAESRGDSYVLNGTKTFITNAPVADVFVIFASTDPKAGALGISAFLVDTGTPGLEVGKPFSKMGLRTSPMSELFFDDCVLPAERMLGKRGNGMAIFNHSIDWERGFILAAAVGTMQRQLETAIEHARTREQFGQPIGKFQAVSHRIVDMKMRLEAARSFLYQVGWAKVQAEGANTPTESALAKLYISEAWVQSSLDTLQILGGYGYMTETEVERDIRDALASRIYSGTSDIQRNIIAGRLGL
ncbi:MAG TPA: acyl-CoA dehydrogenase family protein [Acidimicrobiia bacterium]|nr:acyl-CoA dehydrogenase family protein [Acidimicrobiia bacterium]